MQLSCFTGRSVVKRGGSRRVLKPACDQALEQPRTRNLIITASAVLRGSGEVGVGQLRAVLAVVALGVAIVTAAVASVDHHRKTVDIHRLQENEWFCAHQGLRCDDVGSVVVEERWEVREGIYLGVAGTAGAVFVIAAAAMWRTRYRGSRSVA